MTRYYTVVWFAGHRKAWHILVQAPVFTSRAKAARFIHNQRDHRCCKYAVLHLYRSDLHLHKQRKA